MNRAGERTRLLRGFGLLGGALAWTAHLLGAWLVAEFGCLSQRPGTFFFGVSAIAWLIIGISIASLAAATAATLVSARWLRRLAPERTVDHFVARLGVWSSGIFTVVILVESIPILYFLRGC